MAKMNTVEQKAADLDRLIESFGSAAVAVSGGVDSTTLAYVAHARLLKQAAMVHAVSPAVPPEATERVQRLAARFGWYLRIVDAGEFRDPRYVANPVNRCYFCKTNLYQAIRGTTSSLILSGTNVDDLQDFRPGLEAAAQHGVRHPYVEVGIRKDLVRALARRLGLADLARLPAAPCLSSRMETGIPVRPEMLALVHQIERAATDWLEKAGGRAEVVRCRIRRTGVVLEVDPDSLVMLESEVGQAVRVSLTDMAQRVGHCSELRFSLYRRGSAFLRGNDFAVPRQ
jgi:pyridinium-3,5-biscarboxylic acid mononucleotide sulfurtransferase